MLQSQVLNDAPGVFLVSLRVAHGDAAACAEQLAELNRRIERAAGFRSLDVIRRDGGLGTDFYILARFDSLDAVESWRASPERHALLDRIESMAITDISRQQVAGASVWFEPISALPSPPAPPPLWKRWVLSIVAVYPALVLLVALLAPVTDRVPGPVGLLLVVVILTGLTTAFIVPWLGGRLHGWLHG
jgi:uncharacterized protein